MKKKFDPQFRWGVMAMIVVAFYFFMLRFNHVQGALGKFHAIVMPLIIGFFIAFLLDSLVDILSAGILGIFKDPSKKGLCRGISIFLVESFVITAIALLFSIVIPELITSITGFIGNLDTYMTSSQNVIAPLLEQYPEAAESFWEVYGNITANIREFLNNDVLTLVAQVSNSLKNVGSGLYNVLIGIIVSCYFLAGKNRLLGIFHKLLYTFLSPEAATGTIDTIAYSVGIFKGFFVGKIWDSLIIGVICFLGLSVLRMPYTLLVSITVGVTNVIPYFGPFIGSIPSALLILMVDPKKCLIFLLFILILQQVDGNIIGPKILGNQTGVSSLEVLFSILVGGGLFGVPGMILCVPTYAVACKLLDAFCEVKLEAKNLPLRAKDYEEISRRLSEEEDEEEEDGESEEEKEPEKPGVNHRRPRVTLQAKAARRKVAEKKREEPQEKKESQKETL